MPHRLRQDNTVIAVIEMGLASWLVARLLPGVNREPLKKIAPDPEVLLRLLYRWRDEAATTPLQAVGSSLTVPRLHAAILQRLAQQPRLR
jgi:hypothetical protein